MTAWKFTAAAETGVRFTLDRFMLTPAVRTLYAYDSNASLVSTSFLIMAGILW